MEWPPRSGKTREFPEIDRAEWFNIEFARRKILKSQLALLNQLEQAMAADQ
jgi:predicted NUDIX family NTP pyrophosphohydrolase